MKRVLLIAGLLLLSACKQTEEEQIRAALAEVGAGRFGEASATLEADKSATGRTGLTELGEKGATVAVRVEAVRIVGRRAKPQSYRWLSARAQDPEPEVRAAALTALGGLGVPFAMPLAAEASNDPDPAVSAAAKDALAKLRESAIPFYTDQADLAPSLEERLDGVNALSRLEDPRAVPALTAIFKRVQQPEMKQAILWGLGDIGSPEALAFVRGQLRSNEYLTRSAAIYVVGQHKDAQSMGELESIVTSDLSNGNRIAACRALSDVGTPEAASMLAKAVAGIGDDLQEVKTECRTALGSAQKLAQQKPKT